MTKKTKSKKENATRKYSKSAFLNAEKDSKERLLLNTLLEDGKLYTAEETKQLVAQWKAKKVKEEAKA